MKFHFDKRFNVKIVQFRPLHIAYSRELSGSLHPHTRAPYQCIAPRPPAKFSGIPKCLTFTHALWWQSTHVPGTNTMDMITCNQLVIAVYNVQLYLASTNHVIFSIIIFYFPYIFEFCCHYFSLPFYMVDNINVKYKSIFINMCSWMLG